MLYIRNPMSIEDLLDFEEERINIHQQFSDNDFIQGATEIEQVENEIMIQPLTRKEQLDILRNALRIVDERIDDGGITMRSLRKLQSRIHEDVRKEEAEKQ
ncbi:18360_t:CDS:1, partial [Racocetra fulgida]